MGKKKLVKGKRPKAYICSRLVRRIQVQVKGKDGKLRTVLEAFDNEVGRRHAKEYVIDSGLRPVWRKK